MAAIENHGGAANGRDSEYYLKSPRKRNIRRSRRRRRTRTRRSSSSSRKMRRRRREEEKEDEQPQEQQEQEQQQQQEHEEQQEKQQEEPQQEQEEEEEQQKNGGINLHMTSSSIPASQSLSLSPRQQDAVTSDWRLIVCSYTCMLYCKRRFVSSRLFWGKIFRKRFARHARQRK